MKQHHFYFAISIFYRAINSSIYFVVEMDSVSLEAIVEQFVAENAEKLKAGMTPKDFKSELNAMLEEADLDTISSQAEIKETIEGFGYNVIRRGKLWHIDVVANESESPLSYVKSEDSDAKSDSELIEESLRVKLDLNKDSSIFDIYAAFSLFIINDGRWKHDFVKYDPKSFQDRIEKWLTDQSDFAFNLQQHIKVNLKQISTEDIIKRFYGKNKHVKTFIINSFDFTEFVDTFGKVIEAITPNHQIWIEAYDMEKKQAEEIYKILAEEKRVEMEREAMKRYENQQKRLIEEQKRHEESLRRQNEIDELKTNLYSELKRYGYVDKEIDDYCIDYLQRETNICRSQIDYLHRIDYKIANGEMLDRFELKELIEVACRIYKIDCSELNFNLFVSKMNEVKINDKVCRFIKNELAIPYLKEAIESVKYIGEAEEIIKPYDKYFKNYTNFYDDLKRYDEFSVSKLVASKMMELCNKLL